MAITSITEAHAVNTLLDHLCDLPRPNGQAPDAMAALDAARLLADKAHDKLMAGITAGQVIQHFTGNLHAEQYNRDDVEDCRPCGVSEHPCPYHQGVEDGVRLMAAALRARVPSAGATVDELVDNPELTAVAARRYRDTQEAITDAVRSK